MGLSGNRSPVLVSGALIIWDARLTLGVGSHKHRLFSNVLIGGDKELVPIKNLFYRLLEDTTFVRHAEKKRAEVEIESPLLGRK